MPLNGKTTLTIRDKSAENGSMTVTVAPITVGNFTAEETLRNDFFTACMALVEGDKSKEQFGNLNTIIATGLPATDGQREIKLEIQWYDSVTLKSSSNELPTYDDDFNLPASDDINTAGVEWIALKAAMEAYCLSSAGNPIIVTGGKLVGRNI